MDIETEIREIRALRVRMRQRTEELEEALRLSGVRRYPVHFLKLTDIGTFLESLTQAKEACLIDQNCDCRFCQTQPLITLK